MAPADKPSTPAKRQSVPAVTADLLRPLAEAMECHARELNGFVHEADDEGSATLARLLMSERDMWIALAGATRAAANVLGSDSPHA